MDADSDARHRGAHYVSGGLGGLSSLAVRIRMFQGRIATITKLYFELLTRRNRAAYADAYSRFYRQMASIAAHYFNEDFDQGFPVNVRVVPMMHPAGGCEVFVAEKATDSSGAVY